MGGDASDSGVERKAIRFIDNKTLVPIGVLGVVVAFTMWLTSMKWSLDAQGNTLKEQAAIISKFSEKQFEMNGFLQAQALQSLSTQEKIAALERRANEGEKHRADLEIRLRISEERQRIKAP